MSELLTISVATTVVESGIVLKLIANAIERKKRFRNYAKLSDDISKCISEYDYNSEKEAWKSAEIEISIHDFGKMLTREDENYLKLSGAILMRFIAFLTPERGMLFKEKDFLIILRKNMLELGQSISDKNKEGVIGNILSFCDLCCKYPTREVDAEKSSQLEIDISRSCKILRGKEPYTPYLAKNILESWTFDMLGQTETSLILIEKNIHYMLDDLAQRSYRSRRILSYEIERSVDYHKRDIVMSFDAQSNALSAIISEKTAWKPTKFERSMIYIVPQNQLELFKLPIIGWLNERYRMTR